MQVVDFTSDLDGAPWTDLVDHAPLTEHQLERVGVLPNGTSSGRPAVILLVRDTEGRPTIVQLTYGTWRTLAAAVNAAPAMAETAQRTGY